MIYDEKQLNRAREIIAQIAEKDGTTYDFVYSEIRKAMAIGMRSSDPLVQTRWHQLFSCGNEPTPEEFIFWAAHRIQSQFYENTPTIE